MWLKLLNIPIFSSAPPNRQIGKPARQQLSPRPRKGERGCVFHSVGLTTKSKRLPVGGLGGKKCRATGACWRSGSVADERWRHRARRPSALRFLRPVVVGRRVK